MGQVLVNDVGLSCAVESSPGVLPGSPLWFQLEPNAITSLGAEITTVARNPISRLGQRRKGTIVDLDAGTEHDADLTISAMVLFAEAFLHAIAVNTEMTFRAANVDATGYIIPAATATQAGKLQFTSGGPISLVWGAGYANAANNGAHALTADTAMSGTAIAFSGAVVETAPANAEVSIMGIRGKAGDLRITVSGATATLTSNNAGATAINFTTLGLTVGQKIHVGGLLAANQFAGAGAVKSLGYARITSIAANSLGLDKLDARLITSDGTDTGSGGTPVAVDLLFGRFIRNVPVSNTTEYLRRSFMFEESSPNLYETEPPTPVANPDGFVYVKGCRANEMTWRMPGQNKSDIGFGFVGLNADDPVNNSARKTNAASALAPLFTGAFNTSADFARLRLEDVDATGLSTDFKDMTVTVANNIAPEKVLGRLGARYINKGNFELDIETTALFNNPLVPARIKANTRATMDWILRNDDGAIAVDLPSCTIGNGGREYPLNESVKITLEVAAFVDPVLGTSMSISLFPATPAHPIVSA